MTILLSWEQINHIIDILSNKVKSDGIPDVIIAIQRGGGIPGIILSHLLDVRHFYPISITRTINNGVNAEKIPPHLEFNVSFDFITGKDVLLIDDVAGSGETIKLAQKILKIYSPFRLRSLVCVLNRDNWDIVNGCEPNSLITYIGKKARGWIVFPWERNINND